MFGIERVSKRFIGGTAIAALVLGTGFAADAATAGHKKKNIVRHASSDYQGGCGLAVKVAGNGVTAAPGTCAVGDHYDITRRTGEKYLTITITDQTGQPVGAELWLSDGTGDAVNEEFCGELKNYRMGQASYSLDLNTSADTDCPGAATSGTVAVTYSGKKVK